MLNVPGRAQKIFETIFEFTHTYIRFNKLMRQMSRLLWIKNFPFYFLQDNLPPAEINPWLFFFKSLMKSFGDKM